jgi:hypothetical protein
MRTHDDSILTIVGGVVSKRCSNSYNTVHNTVRQIFSNLLFFDNDDDDDDDDGP